MPGWPRLEVGTASGITSPQVGCGTLQSIPTPPVPSPVAACGSVRRVGWVHQTTLSLQSVPGHAALSPSKHNIQWKKNESNNKSRLRPPCCWHLSQGQEQPAPPFQLGTVRWGRNGERKQNPKQQLSNNCFLQYVQSPAGRASPYSGPRGRVEHGHAQLRLMAPMSPSQAVGEAGEEQGRPGRCRAEVECQPGESHSGAGGRGPESPCPQSWGAARSGDHLPPGPGAPSPGTRLERGPAWPHVPLAEPKCACFLLRPACSLGKPP